MAYIYKITNDVNGKMYIGKTEFSIEKRFREHCYDYNRPRNAKRPLYDAMQKYGYEHFHIELIEETSEPNEREQYWIEYFDTFHNGYNATIGGDGKAYLDYDYIYSIYENTKNISETAKICEVSRDSVSLVLDKYNISLAERLHNRNLNKQKSIAQIDKNTDEVIQIFESIASAAKICLLPRQHISEVCQGKRITCGGYKWKYINS